MINRKTICGSPDAYSVSISNGINPYSYLWNDGNTSQNRSSLCANTYKITITDNNGCIKTSEIALTQPDRSDWQLSGNTNLNANNQFLGSIDNSDLIFKTNNTESARLKSNGEFLINRILTDRIVSPDASEIVNFGDNTLMIDYTFNRLYGNPGGNNYKGTGIGSNVLAFGQHSLVAGYGSRVEVAATKSIVLGTNLKATQTSTFIIGSGAGFLAAEQLINGVSNSILMGCYSNLPTMTITGANGVGTTGKVTIGNVGSMPGNYKLYVEGGILTEKVKVAIDGTSGWADYVFDKDYILLSIKNLEEYIKINKHLPEIPSKSEILAERGVDLLEMQILLLKKIEELTLYIIEQEKRINQLEIR